MKLAIVSDIHLNDVHPDISKKRINIINGIEADYLIMAGDICSNRHVSVYFDEIHPKVKKIIVVKGNHEFYHNDLSFKAMYPDHVVCLTADKPYIDGEYVFMGDTLWTNVPIGKMVSVEYYMNDYVLITNNGEEITCTDTNELHDKQKEMLHDTSLRYYENKKIMVTHHSPTYNSVSPKFANHSMNCAFHSDAIEGFRDIENINLWIHGHTHDELDYEYNDIRVICNPWGYNHERNNFSIKYVEV
jgi:predicted phosphodiesterase